MSSLYEIINNELNGLTKRGRKQISREENELIIHAMFFHSCLESRDACPDRIWWELVFSHSVLQRLPNNVIDIVEMEDVELFYGTRICH